MENEKKGHVETIRDGAIAASIWAREGKNGRWYEFTLSKSWTAD